MRPLRARSDMDNEQEDGKRYVWLELHLAKQDEVIAAMTGELERAYMDRAEIISKMTDIARSMASRTIGRD